MKLRPGASQEFNFSFQSAENFPVDLYFLMDVSATMSLIKDKTVDQSEEIYEVMKSLTENVLLGYGTFVDKRAFPFTITFDSEQTYSFRHRLSLTSNFKEFQEVIRNTSMGINLDEQEGGLDALAQVMVCNDIIKWRKESRKIIVFLTDGYYHAAMDGRLAGIFEPYDGECYTENGIYTKELSMDYPSLGMINKLAVERNMIVFFFVEEKVEHVYTNLSSVIGGSKTSTFSKNKEEFSTKDSIAKTLKEIYEKISSKVVLKKNMKTKYRNNIEITVKPNCISDDSGAECDVEIGKQKKIVGQIKVLEYDGYDNLVVDIAVESIAETLSLSIEVIKNCNCTSIGIEEKSPFCNGENRVCGECDCGDQRYGERCICKKTGDKVFNDNTTCIMEGSDVLCSDYGHCECGECLCRPGYDGKFCQCSNLNCPLHNGQLCSGDEKGKCVCGNCNCEPGWKGDACDCSTFDCIVDGTACNGRGHCVCGSCVCDPLPSWDTRTQHDNNCTVTASLGSHNLQCKILEDCVICQKDNDDGDCISCKEKIDTLVVESLSGEYLNGELWNACPDIKVELGCYSGFVYRYDDKKRSLKIVVEQKENCAETHYLFGGVFLVVLIVIGVVTLVAWKLMTDARDRREYKQFLKKSQHDGARTQNPLYKPASSAIQNPEFRKRSYR